MSSVHKACLICRSQDIFPKYTIKGFHLFQCRRCSLIFVGEQVSKEDLRAHYEKENDSTYDEAGHNTENLNFYYHKLKELICQKKPSGKLLDVGCSSGFFLDCMTGWERYGIELDSRYAQKAQKTYGPRIHIGTLEGYDGPQDFFDVIALQDVLDHMPDPLQALRRCHSLLKADGLLIVKVHDVSCLFAKIMGPKFYAFIPPVHLTYFSRGNLAQALDRSGFKVTQHQYLPQQIFLKTILCRLSQNNTRSVFYSLYRMFSRLPVSHIRIRKNLHDIITVIAEKNTHGSQPSLGA